MTTSESNRKVNRSKERISIRSMTDIVSAVVRLEPSTETTLDEMALPHFYLRRRVSFWKLEWKKTIASESIKINLPLSDGRKNSSEKIPTQIKLTMRKSEECSKSSTSNSNQKIGGSSLFFCLFLIKKIYSIYQFE